AGDVALVNTDSGLPLTADQEFEAGLTCNGKPAAPNPLGAGLATCTAAGFGSVLLKVPKPGTQNDDHTPQRIQARNLFEIAIGEDNLIHADKYEWSAWLEVRTLTNCLAPGKYLSTCSGTY